jgi:hypothetical protein
MLAIEKGTRRPVANDATTTADAGRDGRLRAALGYRVEGPDGDAGVLVGAPFSGRPPRPLVLVVRDPDRTVEGTLASAGPGQALHDTPRCTMQLEILSVGPVVQRTAEEAA